MYLYIVYLQFLKANKPVFSSEMFLKAETDLETTQTFNTESGLKGMEKTFSYSINCCSTGRCVVDSCLSRV